VKKTAARGHTAKHSASSKHGPASKHSPKRKVKSPSAHHASVHTVAKPASHAKPVGLAVAPGDVACCAAQAVAESLRIALSVRVSDEDVLALHWLAGGSADAGVPVLAALEAAQAWGPRGLDVREVACVPESPQTVFGVSPAQPVIERVLRRDVLEPEVVQPVHRFPLLDPPAATRADQERQAVIAVARVGPEHVAQRTLPGHAGGLGVVACDDPVVLGIHLTSVILGLDLPEGAHAVCVGPDGAWWSWGEPYDPATWPDAVVEEAWAVQWH
jgi:hypothetical protein